MTDEGTVGAPPCSWKIHVCNGVGSLTREHGRLLETGSAEAVCALPLQV
jgi:hypothetical protein